MSSIQFNPNGRQIHHQKEETTLNLDQLQQTILNSVNDTKHLVESWLKEENTITKNEPHQEESTFHLRTPR